MQDPSALDDPALAGEILRLEERLLRDRKDYPLNWQSIGSADKARLADCKAERKRRKSLAK